MMARSSGKSMRKATGKTGEEHSRADSKSGWLERAGLTKRSISRAWGNLSELAMKVRPGPSRRINPRNFSPRARRHGSRMKPDFLFGPLRLTRMKRSDTRSSTGGNVTQLQRGSTHLKPPIILISIPALELGRSGTRAAQDQLRQS